MTENTTWPRPWTEIREIEQIDENTIGYHEPYFPLGDDDTMRVYEGAVYVRADSGEHENRDATAWYPLRDYVETLVGRAIDDEFGIENDGGGDS